MALQKRVPAGDVPSLNMAPSKFSNKVHEEAPYVADAETASCPPVEAVVDIDLREVYFLIMHFLSAGPCRRTVGQFWNELLEHQLLPRRYHAWYSRSGERSGDENDSGLSFPLSYSNLVERYPHIGKDHLVKLLKQLMLNMAPPLHGMVGGNTPKAADVPTILGSGYFSLLESDRKKDKQINCMPRYLRWPHIQADQVRGLSLRELGGGFTKHHRAPSIRAACYAIAKPSTMVQKMQNIKKLRGHRDAVYCATFDCAGRYVITGSDDRLVKIWSMETAFCLASCRGHEGDITDLAVSSNNALVASSSNDFVIRVWRLPDGFPISVLRGHTGVVTTIAFSPRPGSVYQLLSSSDDGTCRMWDARYSNFSPRVYIPRPLDVTAGKSNVPASSIGPPSHQILCCAFNANGTVFVTGSSDTLARVWNACKSNTEDSDQANHEMDVLSGHENDVNYVQFSGCAVPSRYSTIDALKEDNVPKFKNSWFTHDNIVTCSRDGSAIIWIPRSRRSHGKVGRWTRAYHLKVPPPPMPPQPPRGGPRGGPRQRFLPTPRGVNMIVWSLDNRFVLAAIMDCRICVWNAADGSLVHSLTGHSESTYVLDVHPFNPRMAMSAGYDGKTILWDIWEGTPIRIYETGRFKLVDGKFSPDGTSIVLSDDVGQIYIINTGQGESQKDAKYDQFFLGDYRPLMQDTHGNVVDQETQLAPYCRNVQDLLCDSSMIPYPEPYQSMYQQRRLGAVGLEWRPPPVKYAVGTDTSIGLQDFQMLPLVDLDRMFDPLPEFIDVMDWEPEIEVQSDDTDSEYNVTEEYSSEAEQGTAGISSFSDSECGEDNEVGHSQKDSLRRSRKKKHKEVEFMTSSGRLVRRRNLDERDGTFSRTNKVKKSRNGRKASRGKSSTSKSSRPRRVAARNALNLFSRISGASTDGEDEVGSEDDSSDSELMNIQSYGSDISMQNGQEKHPREKESFLHTTEGMFRPPEVPRSVENTGNRKRLVLKFSKKPLEGTRSDVEKLVSLVGSSSKNPPATVQAHFGSKEPGSSSGHAVDTMLSQNCCESKIRGRTLYERSEDLLDLPAGYNNNKIRWGEVKARTSKRLRSGMPTDAFPGSTASHEGLKELGDGVDELIKSENKQEMASPCTSVGLSGARSKELAPELVYESGLFKLSSSDELHHRRVASPVNCNGFVNRGTDDQSELCESRDYCEVVKDEKIESSCFTNHFEEAREKLPSSSTKFRIRTKWSLREPESPSKQNPATASEDCRSSACDSILRSPMPMERSLISGVPGEDEGSSGHNQDHRDLMNGIGNSEGLIDKGCSQLALQDLKGLYLDSNNKMYDVAHKRSMSYNARLDSEGDDGARGESSPRSSHNLDLRTDFPEDAPNEPRRTRSMGMNATVQEANSLNCNLRVREHYGSAETSKSAEKFSRKTPEQIPCEEWRSHSKLPVGLRSARIRRGSYYDGDMNLQDKMKSHHSVRKFSWLMLTEHEEGYRYIPQLGDEVIYLRQGHQEFMEMSHTVEAGPWKSIKGNVRATELCKVNELDYSTLAGSGESCCKITLEVVDSTSSVFGRIFKLTLPELNDFPDFIVERTRYDAAMKRNWTHRDKCQVYWREENQEGGSWWEGRILAVKPKSSEFPDSPWERFVVSYKSDSTGTHLHCPWELHDPDIQWEHPHIDVQIREELLDSVTKLEQSSNRKEDYYGIQKLKQVGQKSDFLNRFPVPLSLNIIQQRLQNNYYRSLEALRHDVTVMLFNAQTYFAKNIELSAKMRRLSDWFSEKL